MQEKIYWVGPRKSDINYVKDVQFYGSITIFGDGKDNNYAYCNMATNRVNHNVSDKEEDLFFLNTIKDIVSKDKSARFYFYNPNMVYYVEGLEAYKDYCLCINDKALMAQTNNKKFFQDTLTGVVPLLDRKFDEFHRSNSDYFNLLATFNRKQDEKCRFIFQAPVSSGGNGTYLIDSDNVRESVAQLEPNNYIISVYKENNISVNIHAVIFDDKVLLTPGSVQLIKEDDNRLLYRGADFITYRQIDAELRERFENYVIDACKEFQKLGYRGVCGIDGMIFSENGEYQVVLLEINNRFQASTGLLDIATNKAGLPSLQQINLAAFSGKWNDSFAAVSKLDVNYSNYFFTDNGTKFHSAHVREVCQKYAANNALNELNVLEVEDDGYNSKQSTNSLAYLYRVVFTTNIAAINAENCIRLNENVCEPSKTWYDKIAVEYDEDLVKGRDKGATKDYFIRLKIALLTQGVVLDAEFEKYLKENDRKLRPATNNAIDIRINLPLGIAEETLRRYLIINTPTDIKFVQFSPFTLKREEGVNYIYYYGRKIMPIDETYDKDFLIDKTTSFTVDGKPIGYDQVAFLSTDRLRVHITNSCIFKQTEGKECKFCNIKKEYDVIPREAIEEVVKDYCDNASELGLTHFLVGGQTAPDAAKDRIIEVIEIIHKHAPYADIYAMVIPYPKEIIKAMYDAGMNQLSCNLEVYDDEIAVKYCPGKRATKRDVYIDRLRYATSLMGRSGAVRSMLIVGLEPLNSMYEGIEVLARNGIQPMLSIFRPLPETELNSLCAPSMTELYDIYNKSQQICRKYNLHLGPKCVNCQNNTLALPYWMED